ncbi:hypothetical protein QGM71_01060 [Virgibacillus sp. C22-A2]|uniref:Uncharacterized protein n=1 Tax=Virgibacillus tibetensis TaxID=3042313 RepID=A0ABU6KAK8_9BACI|nr:hypothetical protein [Virgibacillus sp. C22-A2]
MIQTYEDFSLAESERIRLAIEQITATKDTEINELKQIIAHNDKAFKDMYLCMHKWEWGSYFANTPEGFIYRTIKREVFK